MTVAIKNYANHWEEELWEEGIPSFSDAVADFDNFVGWFLYLRPTGWTYKQFNDFYWTATHDGTWYFRPCGEECEYPDEIRASLLSYMFNLYGPRQYLERFNDEYDYYAEDGLCVICHNVFTYPEERVCEECFPSTVVANQLYRCCSCRRQSMLNEECEPIGACREHDVRSRQCYSPGDCILHNVIPYYPADRCRLASCTWMVHNQSIRTGLFAGQLGLPYPDPVPIVADAEQ